MFTVLKFVTCLTIIGLMAPQVHARTSDFSGATYATAVNFEVAQKLRLDQTVTLEEITSGNHSPFVIPNYLHLAGSMHSAMYRHVRDGKPRLVKLILPGSKAFLGDEYFKKEVFGILLSSHIGGPELYRAGRVSSGGVNGYFVEIEELFPGDEQTFTYKGFASKPALARFLNARFPNDTQLLKIAKLLRMAIERKIAIDEDLDFIFSGDDVRWLDTAGWRTFKNDVSVESFEGEMALHNYGLLLTQFFELNSRAGRFLVYALKEEIRGSVVWTSSQRHAVLANLEKNMLNRWEWSGAEYFLQSPPRGSILQKCSQLLSKIRNDF